MCIAEKNGTRKVIETHARSSERVLENVEHTFLRAFELLKSSISKSQKNRHKPELAVQKDEELCHDSGCKNIRAVRVCM